MQIRFVVSKGEEDRGYDEYKLVGCYDSNIFDVDFKLLHYMKENEIGIGINVKDSVDTYTEEYFIIDVQLVVPKFGSEVLPHIEVYLE